MTNVLMIESCVHAYIWLPLPGCMEVNWWKTALHTRTLELHDWYAVYVYWKKE